VNIKQRWGCRRQVCPNGARRWLLLPRRQVATTDGRGGDELRLDRDARGAAGNPVLADGGAEAIGACAIGTLVSCSRKGLRGCWRWSLCFRPHRRNSAGAGHERPARGGRRAATLLRAGAADGTARRRAARPRAGGADGREGAAQPALPAAAVRRPRSGGHPHARAAVERGLGWQGRRRPRGGHGVHHVGGGRGGGPRGGGGGGGGDALEGASGLRSRHLCRGAGELWAHRHFYPKPFVRRVGVGQFA
jgi:hypothetical protein